MILFRLICVTFVVLSCSLYGHSENQGIENIQSIEAKFTQKTISQDNTLVYSGYFYAKAPSKAKWVYHTPTNKEIYINDESTIVYEPLLEQATLGKAKQKIDFFNILKSAKKKTDGKYYAVFDKIEYQLLLKQDGTPKQIVFQDEFENTIIIDFQQVKINHFVDDKIFDFVLPQGIDFIQ